MEVTEHAYYNFLATAAAFNGDSGYIKDWQRTLKIIPEEEPIDFTLLDSLQVKNKEKVEELKEKGWTPLIRIRSN